MQQSRKKALQQARLGISAGFVKATLNPTTQKILQKAPGWQGKAAIVFGIFVSSVKENAPDIFTPDMLYCIATINRNLGIGIIKEDMVQPLGHIDEIDNILNEG